MAKPTASRNGRTPEVHFEPGSGVHCELAALAADVAPIAAMFGAT